MLNRRNFMILTILVSAVGTGIGNAWAQCAIRMNILKNATEKIIAAGNKSKYPAAWAVHKYSTEGTSAGDWCLPAARIFTSYYDNQR